MAIRILTDSGSDVPQQTSDVAVIPMHVTFGEENFLDGVNLSHEEFYDRLISFDTLPVTSQINPYEFSEYFDRITEAGDTAIVITISSELSGTYQSACIAAEDYEGQIFVVDSKNVTVGQRILVQRALDLVDEGKEIEEIVAELNNLSGRIHTLGLLDTLEYLKRGGRISATAAFAGNLLSIKPVVTVKEGKVAFLGTARGSKQGNNYLNKEIKAAGGVDFSLPFFMGYTGNASSILDKYVEDSKALYAEYDGEMPVMTIGGAIGTHVGPGAIAVAFIAKEN